MYELITKSEYEKIHKTALKYISERNKNYINKFLSKSTKSEQMFGNNYSFVSKVEKNRIYTQLTISECNDEWFIVKCSSNQYYKCDQIDGLYLLLSTITNI